jgi:hypothetical protein
MDLFIAVGLTLIGFTVVTVFARRVVAEHDATDIGFLVAGCVMCVIPFFRVVKAVLTHG